MKKHIILVVATLSGCALALPTQQQAIPGTTASSQPATSTATNPSPTPLPIFQWPGSGGALMQLTPITSFFRKVVAEEKSTLGAWKVMTTDPVQIRRIAYRINRSSPVNLEGDVEFQHGINDFDYGPVVSKYRVNIAKVHGDKATYNAYTELSLDWLPNMESVGKEYYFEAIGIPSRAAVGSTVSVDIDIIEVIRRSTGEVFDPSVSAAGAEGEVLTVVAP